MTAHDEDNLKSLSQAIAICRVPARWTPNSDAIARAIANAPETAWQKWEERAPRPEDGPIVGRDCLGYLHLATHLVGGNDPMWVEAWMPVPFGATGLIPSTDGLR